MIDQSESVTHLPKDAFNKLSSKFEPITDTSEEPF